MNQASSSSDRDRPQTPQEERANTISHGAGVLGAMLAMPVLILSAETGWAVIGGVVFACSAFMLYLASTAYHAAPQGDRKKRLRQFDHIAIFVLIAGSYTPFTLGVLRGPWGWSLLAAIWGLAALGILWKVHPALSRNKPPVWLYLAMGWLVVIAIRPLLREVPVEGLLWLLAGAFAYSAGVLFYVREHKPYFHFVWHLFVLAGTTSHFMAIWGYSG